MAWTGKITATVGASNASDLGGSSAAAATISYALNKALSNGTGAGNIDLGHQQDFSVDTTGTTYDLAALAAAATNTGAATFNNVKGYIVVNTDTTDNLTVGNAASAQFTPGFSAATTTVTVTPGSFFIFYNASANGWDAATAKNLKLAAATNTATGVLILLGED
jgi:hypothetical protein